MNIGFVFNPTILITECKNDEVRTKLSDFIVHFVIPFKRNARIISQSS